MHGQTMIYVRMYIYVDVIRILKVRMHAKRNIKTYPKRKNFIKWRLPACFYVALATCMYVYAHTSPHKNLNKFYHLKTRCYRLNRHRSTAIQYTV